MINKKQLKETLDLFPDEFTIEEILDKIILLDKIERGNQQSENGEIVLDSELEKIFKNPSISNSYTK